MTVYAAGAVCWRIVDGRLMVLVVHRTTHRDVSLPKGKVDPGETLPVTAVREVAEETGLSVHLGVPLGVTNYTMPNGREKVVHYWAAEVTDTQVKASRFKPNAEIAGLEWLPVDTAIASLTYDRDGEIVARLRMLAEQGVTRTFAIIALRHAKAVPAWEFSGSDADRPLTERGRGEAKQIVPTLSAYAPTRLVSSTARRCRQTISPIAKALSLEVRLTDAIAQDAYEAGTSDVRGEVEKRLRKKRTAVLCSHGPVLPEIVREIALTTGTERAATVSRSGDLPVGGFSVVHLSADQPTSGIITIESHSPQG
ncbi:NUDIX domain-containing protein [Cnuibacter sp. UC19_7]|uniref:NUDIX hydrolase n=1 Tax=Cnuibacter sp. UC19_7 TaxID=3350166 RepID=UPI0036711E0C